MYADTGLQGAPAALRRLVLHGDTALQLPNSAGFLLYWLASELKVAPSKKLKSLQEYAQQHEEFLQRVGSMLGVDSTWAGKIMEELVHGGKMLLLPGDAEEKGAGTYPMLADFMQSLRAATRGLRYYFKKLWRWCCAQKERSRSPDGKIKLHKRTGRFVHFLTAHFEGEIMKRCIDFVGPANVSVLAHDVLYVRGPACRVEAAGLNAYICERGPLSGVETSRRNAKKMRVRGRAVPVPTLLPPSVEWRVFLVDEQAGDREALYARYQLEDDVRKFFAFYIVYARASDLYLIKETGERVMHRVSFDKHRVQVINGFTGLGKTVVGFAAVCALLREDRHARVIWVVGRVSQAQDSTPRLEDYLSAHGLGHMKVCLYEKATRQEIREAQILEIQQESIWKIILPQKGANQEPEIWRPDLVVLDEVLLILSQSVCVETNGMKLRINDSVLRMICERAPRLLLLDKDCMRTSHVRDFLLCEGGGVCRQQGKLSEVEAQKEIQFHCYTYVPPHLQRGLQVVSAYQDFFQGIVDGIRAGKKFIVACQTQKAAAALYDRLQEMFPHLCPRRPCAPGGGGVEFVRETVPLDPRERTAEQRELVSNENRLRASWADGACIRLLDGQTSNSSAKFLIQTINDFFSEEGPRGLIHTSRVSVCVDIRVLLDLVCLLCGYRKKMSRFGPPARVLCQMLMRARRTVDPVVKAYFGEGGLSSIPRMFEGIDETVLPWEHCSQFQRLDRNYSSKEQRMQALYKTARKPNPWMALDSAYAWGGEVKRDGKVMVRQVASTTKLRLLACLTESAKSVGAAIWGWIVAQDMDIVLPPRLSEAEREALRAGRRGDAQGGGRDGRQEEEGGGGGEEEEEQGEPEAEMLDENGRAERARAPMLQPDEVVIWHGISWSELKEQSVRTRVEFLENKERERLFDHEVAELAILRVLQRYPGSLEKFKKLRRELSKELEEQGGDEIDVGWRVWKWVRRIKALLAQAKKAVASLDNLSIVLGPKTDAVRLDKKTAKPIPMKAASALAMHRAVNRLATKVFGAASLEQFLADSETAYPLSVLYQKEKLLRKLAQQARDAQPGVSDDRQGEKSSAKQLAKFLLSNAGYTMVETGQKKRRQVDGKRTSYNTFTIQKKPQVHDWATFHDKMWEESGERVEKAAAARQQKKKRRRSGTDKERKRKKARRDRQ